MGSSGIGSTGPRQVITTHRLVLRELALEDLDFVALMLADTEVMRYYPKCYSRDEARGWIERQLGRYAQHGHGLWLVQERVAGRPVGMVGLCMQQVDGIAEPEVGYLIHRPYWRQGFATEAAAGTRDYAFDVLDRERVISLIRPENTPSQGVARKLGMVPEDRLVAHGGFPHLVFSMKRRNHGV